jgi:epoxyqueuosine reductase
MLITRRSGSWVVLGSLVTEAELEPTPPLALDCGSCTLCIDACPTGALDEPGTLDATKCLSYWTQSSASIPEPYRAELGDQVYGCDICQDVCPWNRGIEKRRAHDPLPDGAEPHVSLVEWLEADGTELARRYDRLFVPRNDPRYLRRNALVALGNVGGRDPRARSAAERFLDDPDPLLREHAEWALQQLGNGERTAS